MLLRQILVHHGQHLFYVDGVENRERKKSRGILVDRPWSSTDTFDIYLCGVCWILCTPRRSTTWCICRVPLAWAATLRFPTPRWFPRTCPNKETSTVSNSEYGSFLSVKHRTKRTKRLTHKCSPPNVIQAGHCTVGLAVPVSSQRTTNNHEYNQHPPHQFHVQSSTVQRGQRSVVNVRGVFRQEVGLVQHYLLQRTMNATRCFGQGAGQQHP